MKLLRYKLRDSKTLCLLSFALMLGLSQGSTKVDSLLQSLSVEEKIGQMILVYNSPNEFLIDNHIGGVLIMSNMMKKPARLKNQLDSLRKTAKIGLFVSIDQEGGRINRISRLKNWNKSPSAKELTSWTSDSVSRFGNNLGKVLNKYGINMNLAPVLDPEVNRSGKSTFINEWERSFGKSSEEILKSAMPFTDGLQSAGIACISKHFPGYNVEENSDHALSITHEDTSSIFTYMKPFLQSSSKMDGIMMSSIQYTQLSLKPAVLSNEVVSLARKSNENIMVMTDDLWGTALRKFVFPKMKEKSNNYPDAKFKELITLAFNADNDVLMITYPQKVALIHSTISNLVKTDVKAKKSLESSCRRILLLKEKMGLLN